MLSRLLALPLVLVPLVAHAETAPSDAALAAGVARIIEAARGDQGGWQKLEELCDDIGHRLSGSEALDEAIRWAVRTLEADGHEAVRAEPVQVPRWVRGSESLRMTEPRRQPLVMLGLGGSVGTPAGGIEAEVLVAASEEEIAAAGDKARGRIVLFDVCMAPEKQGADYGPAARARGGAAAAAAKVGAVAALVRSCTARSLRTPHTGMMSYGDAAVRIPAAAITPEDADLIRRLQQRGKRVVLRLAMEARDEGLVPSANVVAELRGRERPDEVVVIGGHLDSWDVGQGAHDDGAGVVMAMQTLTLLRRLGMVPRRTIRVVLWTNEENGLAGGKRYAEDHAAELAGHVAALEADSGGGKPLGFAVEHVDPEAQARAKERLKALAALLAPLGPMGVRTGFSGADISTMRAARVPLLGLWVDTDHYFDYHHSPADTLDKVDPAALAASTGAMAAIAWLLAEMPGRLDDAPAAGPSSP